MLCYVITTRLHFDVLVIIEINALVAKELKDNFTTSLLIQANG